MLPKSLSVQNFSTLRSMRPRQVQFRDMYQVPIICPTLELVLSTTQQCYKTGTVILTLRKCRLNVVQVSDRPRLKPCYLTTCLVFHRWTWTSPNQTVMWHKDPNITNKAILMNAWGKILHLSSQVHSHIVSVNMKCHKDFGCRLGAGRTWQ